MPNYHINISNSTFDHGSSVVSNRSSGISDIDEEGVEILLQELCKLQKDMERMEPLIANALSELQQAIKKQNNSKISDMKNQLSSGFASSVLSNIASALVLSFLGISK